ncbi:MAG: hypothetical protein JXB04_12625 [Kiritimatiellae bacterium]|nr:hypothetical protein [Kiritimatiellia bacterium]
MGSGAYIYDRKNLDFRKRESRASSGGPSRRGRSGRRRHRPPPPWRAKLWMWLFSVVLFAVWLVLLSVWWHQISTKKAKRPARSRAGAVAPDEVAPAGAGMVAPWEYNEELAAGLSEMVRGTPAAGQVQTPINADGPSP